MSKSTLVRLPGFIDHTKSSLGDGSQFNNIVLREFFRAAFHDATFMNLSTDITNIKEFSKKAEEARNLFSIAMKDARLFQVDAKFIDQMEFKAKEGVDTLGRENFSLDSKTLSCVKHPINIERIHLPFKNILVTSSDKSYLGELNLWINPEGKFTTINSLKTSRENDYVSFLMYILYSETSAGINIFSHNYLVKKGSKEIGRNIVELLELKANKVIKFFDPISVYTRAKVFSEMFLEDCEIEKREAFKKNTLFKSKWKRNRESCGERSYSPFLA